MQRRIIQRRLQDMSLANIHGRLKGRQPTDPSVCPVSEVFSWGRQARLLTGARAAGTCSRSSEQAHGRRGRGCSPGGGAASAAAEGEEAPRGGRAECRVFTRGVCGRPQTWQSLWRWCGETSEAPLGGAAGLSREGREIMPVSVLNVREAHGSGRITGNGNRFSYLFTH